MEVRGTLDPAPDYCYMNLLWMSDRASRWPAPSLDSRGQPIPVQERWCEVMGWCERFEGAQISGLKEVELHLHVTGVIQGGCGIRYV